MGNLMLDCFFVSIINGHSVNSWGSIKDKENASQGKQLWLAALSMLAPGVPDQKVPGVRSQF